jgi:dipeptidyl aminopeptidase/acylaminoacyl peptidase
MNLFKSVTYLKVIVLMITTFSAQAESVKIMTSDEVNIHGELSVPKLLGKSHAAVILIHQGGSDHTEWNFIVADLLKLNYVVFAYDVRGHGKSDKVTDLYALYNDPKLAPQDLKAVIKYLKSRDYIDESRIAVVGASIGANLANVGIAKLGIKSAVAISGKTSAVKNLIGSEYPVMQSVFYISSNESNGKRAEWAKELFNMTNAPHKVSIIADSQSHGVSIFKDQPEVLTEILEWLQETL